MRMTTKFARRSSAMALAGVLALAGVACDDDTGTDDTTDETTEDTGDDTGESTDMEESTEESTE